MTETGLVEEITKPKRAPWVELLNADVSEKEAAAKTNHKEFYGNRVRGKGDGQLWVEATLSALKGIITRLNGLDRGI